MIVEWQNWPESFEPKQIRNLIKEIIKNNKEKSKNKQSVQKIATNVSTIKKIETMKIVSI